MMSADIQRGMPLLTWHPPPWAHFFKKICQTHVFIYFYSYSYTPWDWWPGCAWRLWTCHVSREQSTHCPYVETINSIPRWEEARRGTWIGHSLLSIYAQQSIHCHALQRTSVPALYAYVTINAPTILLHTCIQQISAQHTPPWATNCCMHTTAFPCF